MSQNEVYFSSLLPELSTRAARATVSRLGFSNPALRKYLTEVFNQDFGKRGAFLGDPVFEATFGWTPADKTMQDLSPGLLAPELIDAMDAPKGDKKSGYRFPRDIAPYKHQLEAWEHLSQPEPRSVVVTSGTGSGKTECFMVPILNQLARELAERRSKLIGVRALFLYPLNALIASQQERLDAWTHHFGDGIRFCLYNGLTPNTMPEHKRRERPNEVIDREVLRSTPPPLLVTNATMLEYMLVRAQDAPILESSQGTLQWIVLDEAHTYIGSQAAELSLLLRRVLHAFGVNSDQVRFVATSATIGGEEAAVKLRDFLASLAGVPVDRVYVVSGRRRIPELPAGDSRYTEAGLEELLQVESEAKGARYDALAANAVAKRLRQLFVPPSGRPANQLSAVEDALGASREGDRHLAALRWLDLLTSVRASDGSPFLPLRLHAFHNVVSGIWACADQGCRLRKGSALDAPEWPYGAIYLEERRHCECGSPVFELRSCNDCNGTFLWARRLHKADGRFYLAHDQDVEIDDFALDIEVEDGSEEEETLRQDSILIASDYPDATSEILVDRASLQLDPRDALDSIRLRAREASGHEPDNGIECPSCKGHQGKRQFRPAILGAPFLLGVIVPTLLEYCPDIDTLEDKPKDRPYRGRRMITFSDSRQGTARMAVKLQQESERNRVRALIFRRIVTQGKVKADARVHALEAELNVLRPLAATNPMVHDLVRQKETELAKATRPQPIPFEEMAKWMAEAEVDVRERIADYYRAMDRTFSGSAGVMELARIFVVREFARRPKRLNSLETMGLVSVVYPKLDNLVELPSLPGLNRYFTNIDQWRAFLKLCLDYHVRENTFIRLPEAWQKWGGNRIGAKQLLPPDSQESQTNRLQRWPQVRKQGNQPRLVRLLSAALQIDLQSEMGREIIDGILKEAWESLKKVDVLQSSGEGRLLDLRDIALCVPAESFICPVTRRVVDVTLNGITPYLPGHATDLGAFKCRPVTMPRCTIVGEEFPSDDQRVQGIRTWLNGSSEVASLREEGLWSDLSDRIVEGAFYYRAVEHSAQQSGERLKTYESDFKAGRVNLMSCSTTMEMGVDIGGISVVAMNNVPPHPANYLQRAGRAGRRSETRSVALTVCKNNPHDQYVLRHTLWPFETKLPAPVIRLSSQVIVQRHANSMLLAYFLRKECRSTEDLNTLDMGWWMLPKEQSPSEQFLAWARCFDEQKQPQLSAGLRFLLRYTCLEGVSSLQKVALDAAAMLEELRRKWFAEYGAIQEQLEKFAGAAVERQPAYKALKIQEGRLVGEYMLRELASEGFLPGYGFPTDIASFETLTLDEIGRLRAGVEEGQRVDNLLRRRELPSRDCATALREYAPGAEVVIDGLVYRSAGITLNWHAPASVQEVKEIQNIRSAWRCRSCGSSGSTLDLMGLTHCPDCGAEFRADPGAGEPSRFQYLEPAGFSVDLFESPHNDVSHQTFIPVESPWMNAYGDWLPLANPKLGAFRSSPLGTVFHFSSGSSRLGYAVCLSCGRAEAMTEAGVLPSAFYDFKNKTTRDHKRLRGGQGGLDVFCDGSHKAFAIKPDIRLGHESRTDVFEMVLRREDGKAIQDRTTAFSLAVALRSAVAAHLGVEVSELGCDIKPVRQGDGIDGLAVVIYDHGASGYSSSICDDIPKLLREARKYLECSTHCDTACQSCLLHFDTRFRVDELNRHAALEFLTEEWLQKLALPEDLALFGSLNSQAEHRPLSEAVTQALSAPGAAELRLFLSGKAEDWDIASSPLRRWVQAWAASGHMVLIVLPSGEVAKLSEGDRFILAMLASLEGVSICAGKALSLGGKGAVAVEVAYPDGVVCWGSSDTGLATPDQAWGTSSSLLVRSRKIPHGGAVEGALRLEVKPPVQSPSGVQKLEIRNQLNGAAAKFGKALLLMLECKLGSELVPDGDAIVGIHYQDRYLNAPMPCALLLEFLSAIKTSYADEWEVRSVSVTLAPLPEARIQRRPSQFFENWLSDLHRREALESAFDYCGIDLDLIESDKRDAIHARVMEIKLRSGKKVRVWLDQGFSYWKMATPSAFRHSGGGRSFPFHAGPEVQGKAISDALFFIEGQAFQTYIFIETQ